MLRCPVLPSAHDCVMLLVVREGQRSSRASSSSSPSASETLCSLGANTLCGCVPERSITITTICLDTDYLVDQIFWQHTPLPSDRLHARQFAKTIYADPAQIVRLGESRAALLTPWLDELVTLSGGSPDAAHFFECKRCCSRCSMYWPPSSRRPPYGYRPARMHGLRGTKRGPESCKPYIS